LNLICIHMGQYWLEKKQASISSVWNEFKVQCYWFSVTCCLPRDQNGSPNKEQSVKEALIVQRQRLATRARLCSLCFWFLGKARSVATALKGSTAEISMLATYNQYSTSITMLLAGFWPNHACFARTCPGQWVLHPRTMLWITATLMLRPAILQAACVAVETYVRERRNLVWI